VLVYQ